MCLLLNTITKFGPKRKTFFFDKLISWTWNLKWKNYRLVHSNKPSFSQQRFVKKNDNSQNYIRQYQTTMNSSATTTPLEDKSPYNQGMESEGKPAEPSEMFSQEVPINTMNEQCKEALFSEKGTELDLDSSQLSRRAKKRMRRSLKAGANKQLKKLKKLNDPNADLNAGYNHKIFEETDYYFENGLRKVYPYYFNFTTYAKERWIGRPVIEVFTQEFRAETEEYYRNAIQSGSMTVNGKQINVDYKFGVSDFVSHKIHRHENPVRDQPMEILHEDDDVVVVNKPSSIPCHPCGRYRFNSLVFILGKEMKRANLRNIYRLDRLTSGVLVCGKTAKRTAELEKHILSRNVEKEYVCRVVGEFPDRPVTVDQPLDVLSNRIAVWKVSANGKPSETVFEKISYNGRTSVVRCLPKTGRTHQIRVHLQYIGYPIVNDPIYNGTAFGPEKGKGGDYGKPESEVIKAIERIHNVGEWADGKNPLFDGKLAESVHTQNVQNEEVTVGHLSGPLQDKPQENACTVTTFEQSGNDDNAEIVEPPAKQPKLDEQPKLAIVEDLSVQLSTTCEDHSLTIPHLGFDLTKWKPDFNCVCCKTKYIDPSPENLVMYLHALRYKGPDWEYSTPLPDWAKEDFDEHTEEAI